MKHNIQTDPETQLMVTCAIRYCVGRRTYMPSLITEWVKRHWDELSTSTKVIIYRDLAYDFKQGRNMGDSCDLETWLSFQEWVLQKLVEAEIPIN